MLKAKAFLCFAAILVCAATAQAQQKFSAYLNGAQHVPPVASPATGTGVVTLNTAETQITVTLTFSGLSTPAFAAHIHGAAPIGQNAPVLFNFQGVDGTSDTVTGTFAVTPKDVQSLRSNRFYFNVHTTNFPNGEIRGQLKSVNIRDDIDGDGRSDLTTLRLAPPNLNITDAFVLNSLDNSLMSRRIPFVVDQSLFGDYNLDGRNDLDAVRIEPPTGNYLHNIFNLNAAAFIPPLIRPAFQWGNNNLGDVPVPGDFDADGIPDTNVFRKTSGNWFILQSTNNTMRAEQFGTGADIPAPSDYDKDGRTDLAVVRNTNGQFVWFIWQSRTNSLRAFSFGLAASDAVLNKALWVDFDGDGAADPSVVRKLDGERFIYGLRSSDGLIEAKQWGLRSDRTTIVDADGDGRSDVAAIRSIPEFDGQLFWYIWQSSNEQLKVVQFGRGADVVVAVD